MTEKRDSNATRGTGKNKKRRIADKLVTEVTHTVPVNQK